jgi:predicted ATPase/DNA-binding winged helix-turn-helix (wHTH) protein
VSPSPEPDAGRAFSFGPFRLQKASKHLTEDGATVRLGSRALELLLALVEHPGEVLSRQTLEARVWPRTVVEETSLRVHIAALRKALRDGVDGARYITNIPGRGYCFVAPVQVHADALQPAAAIAIAANRAFNNLPSRLTTVVGRRDVTLALGEHLRQHRLVSITGPGGIGKTTVALAVASEHIAGYEHGAVFVDFAPLTAADLVPSAVAIALGCQPTSGSLLPQICEFLRDRRVLLVLDNCEHVVGAAAHLVETLMQAAPEVQILTTTREPLFAEGEWVYRLSALEVPGSDADLTHEQALAWPAIRLFVERAEATSDDFSLCADTLPAVCQLCQRLDGIPLAIELAAARVGSLGVKALAQRLDDLFRLLNRGRRTAMPRHQTLEALFDWSFDLLTEQERVVLRRLSAFRSSFNLGAAVSVAACERIEAASVVECVSSLALKSLLHADTSGVASQFRLLHMTRAYAARKLADSGELGALQRRHAEYFLEVAKSARDRFGLTAADRSATFGPLIDDLRAALDWAFSPDGDDQIAVAMTAGAWVASLGLGLFGEYRARVELALERARSFSPPQPQLELALCVCWCFLSSQTPGMGGPRQQQMFDRVLALAAQTADVERRAEALYAISTGCLGQGRYDVVKQLMTELKDTVHPDAQPLSVLLGDRLLVLAHHHLGAHAQARALAQKVLHYKADHHHAWFIGQVPRSVSMLIVQSRILWLEGASDQAVAVARQAVENGIGEHPFALAQALALAAIPVALWRGDDAEARELNHALQEHAARHSLAFWHSWAEGYRRYFDRDLDRPWTNSPGELDMLATVSPSLLVPGTLTRVDEGSVAWCGPEVLRAHALRLLDEQGEAAAELAEALCMRGLAMAREHGSLAWELRIATSLAGLRSRARAEESRALLADTLVRFVEGAQTRDLVQARAAHQRLDAVLQRSVRRVDA